MKDRLLSPQYIAIPHRVKAKQGGAKVDPKPCNHFEKRSATASDWGAQSEAKTNPTSCNSGQLSDDHKKT